LYDDKDGNPSAIKCSTLSFFDAVYFISITVTSVGYGDIAPVTQNAKLVVILFILATVVIIPARIAELQKLLSLSSPYQNPYVPQNNERHVIVTGHTSDKRKLERFLKEFFHPDRQSNLGQDSHCVILSTSVPNEDIRSLILGQALESKITWVLGSALAVKDLKRVKAKQASAIFFLCNTDQNDAYSTSEDAANVLRALSASNFNTEIECMVQVLRPENSAILKESDIKFILCLDEFKTAVQARNAVVPGFSTFIENIFHSFGSVAPDVEKAMPPWYKEYLHGAGMELYYAPLPAIFLSKMRYNFKRIAEAIYIEYDCIVLGVCNEAKTSVVFNPNLKDLSEFKNVKEFFSSYSVALIMADDQYQADQISEGLADPKNIAALMEKCDEEEAEFPCRSDGTFAPTAGVFKKKSATHHAAKKSSPSGFGKFFSLTKIKSSDNSVGSESDDDDDSSKGYTSEEFEEDSDDEIEENYIGYRKKSLQTANGARIAQDFEEIGFGRKASIRPSSSPATGRSATSTAQQLFSPLQTSSNRNKDEEDGDSHSDEDENSDDESEEADTFGEVQAPIRAIITQNTFGLMSTELQNASNLSNHVIVHGCSNNFQMFVSELRRPAVKGDTYHPILIVDESIPSQWPYIKEKFNDVYFLKGKLSKSSTLHRVNIKNAFSLTLLAARNEVSKVDDQANNSSTLFNYLKLEAHLPKSVFVSVELTSSSNMVYIYLASKSGSSTLIPFSKTNPLSLSLSLSTFPCKAVLNATIMRRVRESVSGSNHKAEPNADEGVTTASSSTPNKNQNVVSPSVLANLDLDAATDTSIKARVRRKDAIFDGDGRFASKRTSIIHNNTDNRGNTAGGARSNLGNIMGPLTFPLANTQQQLQQQQQQQQSAINRRASTLGVVVSTATSAMSALVDDAVHSDLFKFDDALEELCDAMDSHHVLPVFASAKAFMPSSFESLLVQSFYVKLTPIICEKFVIGQLVQTVMQIAIPKELVGRRFIDLYRLFLLNQVLCFGLFRAPQFKLGATLPYVYIAPPSQTILNANDRVYAFGSPANMARAKIACHVNLRR